MPIDTPGSPLSGSVPYGSLPAYHRGLLMVKVRPTPTLTLSTFPTFAATLSAPAAPGLAMLAAFERAGMIKKVVPVAPPEERPAFPSPPLTTMAMTAAPVEAPTTPTAASILQGLSVVEVERDEDADNLRMALAQDPNVESVSRVPCRYLVAKGRGKGPKVATEAPGVESTPPPASTMWNLAKVQWAQARALPNFKEPADIQVGILDSGVDFDHPDLKDPAGNRVVKNYTYAHPDLPGVVGFQDIVGHGTHVTGTIAAAINNNLGINGICNCYIRHWKIFQDTETTIPFFPPYGGPALAFVVDPIMYHRALARAIELRIAVMNLSIGGGVNPNDYPTELDLFSRLIANGTVVVAAMGNSRADGSPTSYPAAYPGVIAVGSTGLNDVYSPFSNRGNHIALCAPGEAIWSTLPTYPGRQSVRRPSDLPQRPGGTDYAAWQGTSMAAPHVTAAVAMLLATKGSMSPGAVRDVLRQTVDPVPGMAGQDWTPDYGSGRLNLFSLLK